MPQQRRRQGRQSTLQVQRHFCVRNLACSSAQGVSSRYIRKCTHTLQANSEESVLGSAPEAFWLNSCSLSGSLLGSVWWRYQKAVPRTWDPSHYWPGTTPSIPTSLNGKGVQSLWQGHSSEPQPPVSGRGCQVTQNRKNLG